MSSAERKAWMTEAMKIAHFFRQNAATRHAVPECAGATAIEQAEEQPKVEPPQVHITNNIPAAPNTPSPGAGAALVASGKSLLRRAAPFILTAATGAGVPIGLWSIFGGDSETPAIEQPADKDGSLLQHLEDNGLHLPEGESWTK